MNDSNKNSFKELKEIKELASNMVNEIKKSIETISQCNIPKNKFKAKSSQKLSSNLKHIYTALHKSENDKNNKETIFKEEQKVNRKLIKKFNLDIPNNLSIKEDNS